MKKERTDLKYPGGATRPQRIPVLLLVMIGIALSGAAWYYFHSSPPEPIENVDPGDYAQTAISRFSNYLDCIQKDLEDQRDAADSARNRDYHYLLEYKQTMIDSPFIILYAARLPNDPGYPETATLQRDLDKWKTMLTQRASADRITLPNCPE